MGRPRIGAAALAGAFVFFIFLIHLWATSSQSIHSALNAAKNPIEASAPGKDFDSQIRNGTLGFEKIFVLNLPSRGDRLDAFILSSSLTGFTAEAMPGINGATVLDKSLPSTEGVMNDTRWRNAQVGTWRAHLNIARTILNQGLSSALIFEDDSDWDVSLKDRMVDFAHGARYFSESAGKESTTPYGDDWDMLWPGHCAIQVHTDLSPGGPSQGLERERFLIENDPTVPAPTDRNNMDWVPDMSAFPNTTRMVFKADMGICLYAYALSYAGAQKVLQTQNTLKKWVAIDIGLGEMCQNDDSFNCIGVYPQLVNCHRMAGTEQHNSDIIQDLDSSVREEAYTWNIKYSSRLNTDRLLYGQDPVSQFTDAESCDEDISYRVVDQAEGAVTNIWPPNRKELPPEDHYNNLTRTSNDTSQ